MQTTSTTHRTAMLVAAVVLLGLGLGTGYQLGHRSAGEDQSSSRTATTVSDVAGRATANKHNESDVMFTRMMVPHHQQALEMAALAQGRAESSAVKDLAAQIQAAQQPEIDAMNAWLTSWAVVTDEMAGVHHSMSGGGMTEDDMTSLAAKSGAAFDRAFLAMMVKHHDSAIDMAKDELAKGQSPHALALAASIQVTQQAEVTYMKSLLN